MSSPPVISLLLLIARTLLSPSRRRGERGPGGWASVTSTPLNSATYAPITGSSEAKLRVHAGEAVSSFERDVDRIGTADDGASPAPNVLLGVDGQVDRDVAQRLKARID